MPFCPSCRYEYVPGIVQCPDCYVDLVETLDEPSAEPSPVPEEDFNLVSVGSFEDHVEAEMVQLKLQSEGIESVLDNDTASGAGGISIFSMMSPFAVEVKVREEDAARAAAIIEEVQQGHRDE